MKKIKDILAFLPLAGAAVMIGGSVAVSLVPSAVNADYNAVQTAALMAQLQNKNISDPSVLKSYIVNDSRLNPEGKSQDELEVKMTAPAVVTMPTVTQLSAAVNEKKGSGNETAENVVADLTDVGTNDSVQAGRKSTNSVSLKLTKEHVTVNNGDTFNPNAFVIVESSGVMPVISIDSNVDTSTDGEYTVVYSIVAEDGSSIHKELGVTVQTPEEMQQMSVEPVVPVKTEEVIEPVVIPYEEAVEPAVVVTVPAVNSTAEGEAVVETARQYIGSPYVYGGSSPAGFDCSGFTSYIYSLYGIALNRSAADQMYNGYQISADQVQAGDLMIWSGHVAICEGNGYVIEAGSYDTGVWERLADTSSGSGYFMGYYRIPAVNG